MQKEKVEVMLTPTCNVMLQLTTLIAKDGKGRSDKPDDRVCAQEPESEAG